ncbi:hypothetical protein [Actinoplanes sp. NPDC020271]|uniref:hypothetical protein n=1 Tax=Actinoplanes sp. NPDC020271 TaxID=3363896 RepID=UPI0037A93C8E
MSSAAEIQELVDKIRALAAAELPSGHVVAFLRESQEFWEPEERELIEPIGTEYQAQSDELADRLAEFWGRPARVPLWPVLDRSLAGEDVPPLAGELSQFAVEVDTWRVGDRVVCVGVGHHDKELPIVLFAAVGDHRLDDETSPAVQSSVRQAVDQ